MCLHTAYMTHMPSHGLQLRDLGIKVISDNLHQGRYIFSVVCLSVC